jgi:Tfp pilus assembly protein PilN
MTMRPANLLPPDLAQSRRKMPTAAIAAVGAGAAVGVLLAGGYVITSGTVDERRNELQSLRAELAAVPAPARPVIPVRPELETEKTARRDAVAAALAKRVAWDRVLRELSQVLPEDVWLESMSASAATPAEGEAAAAGGAQAQGFTLKGMTYSQEAVARFLSRLTLLPSLDDVTLQESVETERGNRQLYSFVILANVSPAAVGGTST